MLDKSALTLLQTFPDVENISEDGIMHTTATIAQFVCFCLKAAALASDTYAYAFLRSDAPWGLARLSSDSRIVGEAEYARFRS